MEHDTLRPCAKSWCVAFTCSMEQKPTRTCSKKTQTQRHGTLVDPHVHRRAGPGTPVPGQRPGRPTRWTRAGPGSRSQTVTFVSHAKQFKRTQDTELSWGSGHVQPCCCLCFSKRATAPPSSTRPPVLSPALSKITENHSSSSSIVEVISSATLCSWICGTRPRPGTPIAPVSTQTDNQNM